jgi:hypothetical protein
MRYERDTVDRVRSIMGPGNPVPHDTPAGSWHDPAGQETRDRIMAVAGQDAVAAPSPPRPARSWLPGRALPESGRARRMITPVAAGLAVAGLITGLALAVGSPARRPATGAPAATAAAGGMPRFYVTLSAPGLSGQVVAEVHASLTGRVVSQVTIGGFIDENASITADRSDRAFVIDATIREHPGAEESGLFLLRISASGHPTTLKRLPLILLTRSQSQDVVDGIAVSPDGTRLAVALQVNKNENVLNPRGEIVVYSLTGGATQTWTAPKDAALPWNPAWTSGSRQLTFLWQDQLKGTVFFFTGRSQVRVLDTSAPGRNLLASSVIATGGGKLGFIQAALAGPGNSPVIAAAFRDVPSTGASGTALLKLVSLSPAGTVSKVLVSHAIAYSSHAQMVKIDTSCQVLGIDASGQHTIAYCPVFGRIDNGTFTPLPGNRGEFAAAW